MECSGVNTGIGSESGHCLRFSETEQNYNGYSIGSPRLEYEISFAFRVPSEFGFATEALTLRSGQNTLRSNYGKISVEGDLQTP